MNNKYEAPILEEEIITLEDIVATSSFGSDYPGDISKPFSWIPFKRK